MSTEGRILLADAREQARVELEAALVRNGFGVFFASTGDELLNLLHSGEEYDCVVADFDLPGMEGGRIVTCVRQECPQTQVIVVDGEADTRTYLQVMNQGAFDYFPPETRTEELLRQVRRAVRASQAQRHHP